MTGRRVLWLSVFAFLTATSAQSAEPATNMARAVELPTGAKLETVDFERHIMGLFGKTGCNNGSCHGSFQGKNGFRLSLFGFEPDKDFASLTRDLHGRRIDTVDPDSSLLLQKAAGLVRHEGGTRFSKDSWQYAIFREWIRQGARRNKGGGTVAGIEISPKEYVFIKPGETARMKVTAKFEDGSTEDITPFCDYRIADDAVAKVSPVGYISANRPGDTGFVVLYRGQVASARVLVPTPKEPGFTYPNVEAVNFIDREVQSKLKLMNVVPSAIASDEVFLRRATIDVTGQLPTAAEVRAFVADTSADKRTKKIDDLLQHPLHSAVWATKFSDITGNNTLALENPQDMANRRSQMWHDWIRKRLERNMPYDEIVKGILTASSLEGRKPDEWLEHVNKIEEAAAKYDTAGYVERQTLDLFWRRQQPVPTIEWGEKVAAAFMGVRLECAQCHKHPTDRWTQADYRAFANIFAGVTFVNNQFSSPDLKKVVDAENKKRTEALMAAGKNANQRTTVREMFISLEPRKNVLLNHPDTNVVLNPKAPGGPEFKYEKGQDIRAGLFEWLRSPENPFFAKSFVNRVWAHYFGVGLVDPVDDFSLANPPTNTRLLEALAKDFVASKYDIRHLERQILLSRTYQTSSEPNATNKYDRNNFARSYIRPMMAEVVVDLLNDAIGVKETFNGTDKELDGKRMTEVGASRINNANLTYALRIFGRPPRTTACDCERAMEPALPQTLFRMTDAGILQKLKAPTNRVGQLLKAKSHDDDAIYEELVLSILGRKPTASERAVFKEYRGTSDKPADRLAAFTDVLWALINTREFILNH
jgi:Protein of unknown function (DUF1549)/Protein of unknown function (DUF1553)